MLLFAITLDKTKYIQKNLSLGICAYLPLWKTFELNWAQRVSAHETNLKNLLGPGSEWLLLATQLISFSHA